MKKLIFAIVAGCIPALVATTGAYAQILNFNEMSLQKETIGMERATPALTTKENAAAVINTRAIKDFSKSYKKASNVSWSTASDGFTASFNADGIRTIVYYNKKGRWAGSLKGYTENKMPRSVRELVKREYYDFDITYVQEVETINSNGQVTYVVHLQDANTILLVRVCDGVLDIWEEYQKQK